MLRSDASKRHDANSCGPAQCRIDASLPTGGRSGRHSKPSARNSITREARVQPATERELPTPREEGIAKPAEWGTPTWPVFLCASGETAARVRPPLPIPPSQTFRGIMRDSVLKHWMRSGLLLVAGVAVAVGCGTKESTGPAADYTLSLAPAALTIVQGANGTATVTITRTNFTGAVTLSLGGAPTGVTGSFNPAAPTGTSATLTVSVGGAVAAGVYNLTVAGAGSAGNRSTPLTLTVNAASDYTLSVAPTALTIAQGANGTTTVTITRTSFTGAVTLSLGNAPTGVTGSFNPTAPTGTTSALTVSVGAAVAPGVYNLTVNGTGAPGNRSTPLTLTVSAAPDYTLSLSPTALTIGQGATGNTTVTITRTNFTGAVTLSLGSAPAGVTGSFSPAAPTGTSSTLTVSVAAAVAPGVYNFTVDGTGTPGNRSTPLTLTVSGSAPRSLINGQTHSGTISAPGELHTWTFTATAGDYIALSIGEVAPVSVDFTPWIRLVSPTGALLANSSGASAAQTAATAPATGTYTVIVGTADPGNNATGSYLLTLAKAPGAFVTSAGDEGGPLTNGATQAGAIYLGDLVQ